MKSWGQTAIVIAALLGAMWLLRSDHSDMRAEHADMRAEHADIRAEMGAEHSDIRADMRAEHSDMRAEHAAIRNQIGNLDTRIDSIDRRTARIEGRLFGIEIPAEEQGNP